VAQPARAFGYSSFIVVRSEDRKLISSTIHSSHLLVWSFYLGFVQECSRCSAVSVASDLPVQSFISPSCTRLPALPSVTPAVVHCPFCCRLSLQIRLEIV